jgi:hypothetical protein
MKASSHGEESLFDWKRSPPKKGKDPPRGTYTKIW